MAIVSESNPVVATARARIQGFLDYVEGVFTLRDLYEALGARSTEEKATVRRALSREKQAGSVENNGNYGTWRKIDQSLELLDLSVIGNNTQERLQVELLGLENLISFKAGDLLVIAGLTNTGKTSGGLGFARGYRGKLPVTYLSSEVTGEQIQERARLDGIQLDSLKFLRFAMRYDNYQDVVSENGIYIIDYLAAPGSGDDPHYFAIPHMISKIHGKLNGTGLVLICLQKDPGKKSGEGGHKTLHRANLYLTLDKDNRGRYWVNIQKCKARSSLEGYRLQYEPKRFGLNPISDWMPP